VDEDLIGAFEIFDEDKDGYISPTEIQLLFKKLGELISTDEAVEIMKDCDLNKDGLIDFEEFKAFYLKIFENQPTLAEQLVAEAEADEKQKVALAMEEKEASGYPQGEAPSPTDYKWWCGDSEFTPLLVLRGAVVRMREVGRIWRSSEWHNFIADLIKRPSSAVY